MDLKSGDGLKDDHRKAWTRCYYSWRSAHYHCSSGYTWTS